MVPVISLSGKASKDALEAAHVDMGETQDVGACGL